MSAMPPPVVTDSVPPSRGRALRVLVVVALVACAVLAIALVVMLETPIGVRATATLALRMTQPFDGLVAQVGGARGGAVTGLELHGIRFRNARGQVVLAADTLRLGYRIPELLGRPLTIRSVAVSGLFVDAPALPPGGKPSEGPPFEAHLEWIAVDRASLRLALPGAPRDSVLALRDLFGRARDLRTGRNFTLVLDTLGVAGRVPGSTAPGGTPVEATLEVRGELDPDVARIAALRFRTEASDVRLAGTVPTHPESSLAGLDVTLRAGTVGGRDLGRAASPMAASNGLDLTGHARSDGARTAIDLDARARDGGTATLTGSFETPHGGPLGAKAHGVIRRFDLAGLLGGPRGTRVIEARIDADVAGRALDQLDGPVSLSLTGSRMGDTRLDEAALSARFVTGRANLEARARSRDVTLNTRGWVRPFDARPSGDLTARAELPAIHLGDDAAPVLYHGAATLTMSFAGVRDTARTGSARLTLEPAPGRAMLLTGGTAELRLRANDLHAHVALAVADGSLETDGDLALGPEIGYRVPALTVRDVSLASFARAQPAKPGAPAGHLATAAPDTLPLSLDADLALAGHGFAPATMHLDARASRLDLRRGNDPIVRARANATIDRGRLALDADAALDTGTVALHGTAVMPRGDAAITSTTLDAHARIELRDARLAGHRIAGESTIDLQHGRAHVAGSLDSDAGRGTWEASARPFDPTPAYEIERLTFAGVEPGVWTRQPEWRARLDGQVTGTVRGTDPDSLVADTRWDLAHSRIGAATFDRLTGSLHADHGVWKSDLEGHSNVGRGAITAQGRIQSESLRLTTNGALEIPRLGVLVGRDSLAGAATAQFEGGGTIPLASPAAADLEMHLDGRARLGEARLDTIRIAARLRDSVLTVTRLEASGEPLALKGGGTLPLPHAGPAHPGDLRLDLNGDHLERLGRVLGLPTLASGPVVARLEARGPSGERDIRITASALRAALHGVSADSLGITGGMRLAEDRVIQAQANGFAGTVILGGLAPRDITASLVWDGEMLTLDARSQADATRFLDLGAKLWPAERRARLERVEGRQLNTRLALAHPADIEYADGVRVHDLVLLADGKPGIRLDGGVDSTGRVDARGSIEQLPLEGPMQFVGLTALGGVLDAGFTAAGTLDRPDVKSELHLALNANKKPLLGADGHAQWTHGQLVADLDMKEAKSGALTLKADLPLVVAATDSGRRVAIGDGPLDGSLVLQGFDLAPFGRIVPPRVLRKLSGVLDGEARLGGTAETPRMSGAITLDKGGVEVPSLGAYYRDGSAHVGLDGRTMTLDRFALRSGGGTLSATGKVELQKRAPATFDLDARLARFRVMDSPNARIAASGPVKVTGTYLAPKVSGELTLEDGVLWVAGSSEEKFEAVELTEEDMRQLRTRFDLGLERPATTQNDVLTLDLGIKIGTNLWLRTRSDPVLALELRGDFRTHKEPGQPLRIAGNAGVLPGRSSVSFLGRRFDVSQASVEMPGDIKDAKAKVEARYDASNTQGSSSDVEVTAFVTADASGTEIDLRSRPHLERDEILRFITTGQAPGTTGSAGGNDVAGLAAGWLLGTVGGAAGQKIGIDVVQVTQDAYGGHTMSAGSYVHPRVYLGVREPINALESSANGPGTTTLKTEYDIGLETLSKLLIQVQGNDQQTRIFLRPRLGH